MSNTSGVISFDDYRIVKVFYECNPGFEESEIDNGEYKYEIAYSCGILANKTMQLNLFVRCYYHNSKDYDNAPLKLEVVVSGIFHTIESSKWDNKWNSNALAILFPYVRSFIASMTSQMGRETIHLPTINTMNIHETDIPSDAEA